MKLFEIAIQDTTIKNIDSLDDARAIITDNCVDAFTAFQDGGVIYRGISRVDPVGFIGDSRVHVRRSANTLNYYTLLIDNDPAWEKFPKRSASFICSTSEDIAMGYGQVVYLVFPYDGVKIAGCGKYDFWESFDYRADQINSLLYALFTTNDISTDDTSLEELNKNIDKLEKIAKSTGLNLEKGKGIRFPTLPSRSAELIDEMNKHGVLKTLRSIFSPKKHRLIKAADLSETSEEIWFSGKAVFVNQKFEKMLMEDK